MVWIVGVDEAGYGPNLGPFVMTAAACRADDALADACLWSALRPAVRRAADADDGRVAVDDSKLVYTAATRGLAALERGVLAALWRNASTPFGTFLTRFCGESAPAELRAEPWYTGAGGLPGHAKPEEVAAAAARFDEACAAAGVRAWRAYTVVVCPARFNALLDAAGSKGAVLAHALGELLRASRTLAPAEEAVAFHIDKHGGRNRYTAQIQHALAADAVLPLQEGMSASVYRVLGMGRDMRLTFRPRADVSHFCVALASMVSKYVRERLMEEFNRFWLEKMPGLKPTAGYPGDARRFYDAIRPTAEKLGIPEAALWRKK
jgi:ribonuclease HII